MVARATEVDRHFEIVRTSLIGIVAGDAPPRGGGRRVGRVQAMDASKGNDTNYNEYGWPTT
jgi:hypothetical protein